MGSRFQGSIMARVLAFSALLIHSSLGCTVVSQRSRRSTALPDHGERSLLHRDLITSQDGDAKKTKFYDCCKEPYPSMEYKFTVRKSSALPAPLDEYFASYKTDMLVTSNPKTTKLRGY